MGQKMRNALNTAVACAVLAASVSCATADETASDPQRSWPESASEVPYVNPYPDGILPVGDGKIDSEGPRFGHMYACREFGMSLGENGIGGAVKRGPWFTEDGKGWDPSRKPHIQGDIPVPGQFHMEVRDGKRLITTNELPVEHNIGQFPVSPNDPAYVIDPNPNTVDAQERVYELPERPKSAQRPGCVGHQVGVLIRGAALYSPVDAEGRDAVAWEVQDRCDGHPEPDGSYHYHGPSPCLPGTETNQVIGFALDGFPITGNRDVTGRKLWSRDLDTCHGGVADVIIDGYPVRTYRYVLTEDWPYSVACFAGGNVPGT